LSWPKGPVDWSPPSGERAPPGYVGSEACKRCHAEIYASYARHSMARSGLRPISPEQAALFDGAPVVEHAQSGFSYRPLRRGKRLFVEERLGGESLREVEVTHALSAGSYGIAFYLRRGDRLYQAPVDYYPQARAWGMDPGDVGGNARFTKALGPFCISCHSDEPRRRAGAEEAWLDPLPAGIGCERCHGPGEQHVRSLRAEDVVNPARLPRQRQLDVCAQCHLSSFAQLRAGRGQHDFRPGGRLDEVRVNFVAEPPDPERVDLLAHTERLVRSACWRKSGMTCTTCHDPHKSSFDQPAAWWDKKCAQCHVCKEKRTAGCPGCHMRKGPPWNPTQVTVTDHWIQRRPPPLRPGRPAAPSLRPFSSLVGETLEAPDLPALTVLALSRAGHREQAVAQVPAAVAGWPRVPALYDWLADQLGPPRQKLAAVTQALRADPGDRGALLLYARLQLDAGHEEDALRALDRLIAVDADDAEALELEGMVALRDGRPDQAAALLRRAAAGPNAAAAHVGLAVLTGSRAELLAAHALEPGDSWILQKLGRPAPARNLTAATGWLPPAYR
jgi:Tetratricopeptide repeat/Cytochrome c554 and c-prime